MYLNLFSLFVFFKQKTAYEMRISDWSSDVCSSDLHLRVEHAAKRTLAEIVLRGPDRELRGGMQHVAIRFAHVHADELARRDRRLRDRGQADAEASRYVDGRRLHRAGLFAGVAVEDRKSTRLNSSH